MRDDFRSDDGLGSDGRKRERRREAERQFADREVPLVSPAQDRTLAPAVHAWLDGELPEAALRTGTGSRDVEFWNRVGGEMERRRHMKTPAHVEAQIMAALPQTAPHVITPWLRREFVVTPASMIAAAAALVAVASIATAVILQALG